MGRFGVRRLWPFMLGFTLLWLLVLASGIHATMAGVLAALTIPLGDERIRLSAQASRTWHPSVGDVRRRAAVRPGSAGVSCRGGLDALLAAAAPRRDCRPVRWQTAWDLRCYLAGGPDPVGPAARHTNWRQLFGASLLCGIGFTMSLFIGALAFPGDQLRIDEAKIGTLAGSLLSAIAGYFVLRFAPPMRSSREELAEVEELFAADDYD